MGAVLVGLYQILLKKEVRLKHVELLTRKEAKEAKEEARSLEAEKIRYFTGDLMEVLLLLLMSCWVGVVCLLAIR